MARRPTEKARCDLGCRHPTLARAAAQRRANMPNVTVKAGAPPLSPFPHAMSKTGKQVKHAETITDSSSMPKPSVLGATQDSRPGRCQTSKFAPSSSAKPTRTASAEQLMS